MFGYLLADVYIRLIELEKIVESNPDVDEIIKTLEQEFEKQKEDSRFLIFVKARATAKALANRLPLYLKSSYLTGRATKEKCGIYILIDKHYDVCQGQFLVLFSHQYTTFVMYERIEHCFYIVCL